MEIQVWGIKVFWLIGFLTVLTGLALWRIMKYHAFLDKNSAFVLAYVCNAGALFFSAAPLVLCALITGSVMDKEFVIIWIGALVLSAILHFKSKYFYRKGS